MSRNKARGQASVRFHPATIEDVARIAEVSIATVSRAIHMPEKVAKSTRLKVNQAIALTGYTTNAMARSLRLGRSNMILVVAPDIGDPNFSSILVGLENEARAHGYGVLIGHTQNDAQRGLEYLKFFNSNQAAGLILFTGILPFGHQEVTPRLPPTVGVFEPVFNGGIPYVGVDDVEGARKAVDLLISEGHRRIAFIGDSHTRLAYGRRRSGYEAGLAAAGIPRTAALSSKATERWKAAGWRWSSSSCATTFRPPSCVSTIRLLLVSRLASKRAAMRYRISFRSPASMTSRKPVS